MDHYVAVVSDAQGNVYTAGTAHRDTVTDTLCYVTTKYNQWGRMLWRSLDRHPSALPTILLIRHRRRPTLSLTRAGTSILAKPSRSYWVESPNPVHWIRVIKFNGSTGGKLWNQPYLFGGPNVRDFYLSGMVYDSVYGVCFCAAPRTTIPRSTIGESRKSTRTTAR